MAGVQWEDSDRMADLAEGCGNVRGLRDALLIRIMSDGLMRVSEAEALDVADLALSKRKLLVTIRRSKTDQDGRGVVFRRAGHARLARKWLDTAGIEEGPVFRPVNKAGRVGDTRLTARSVRDIVKYRAADAGIEGRVSGHSLRVGSAQSLRDRGATTADLMDAGRGDDGGLCARTGRGAGSDGPAALRSRAAKRSREPPPSARQGQGSQANGGGHGRRRSACEGRRKKWRKGLHASKEP